MKKVLSLICICLLVVSLIGCSTKTVLKSYETQKLPEKYTQELAENNKDILIGKQQSYFFIGKRTYKFSNFIENINNKIVDKIRVVYFTNQNSAIIYDLIFDGENISIICDNTRDIENKNGNITEYKNVKIKEGKKDVVYENSAYTQAYSITANGNTILTLKMGIREDVPEMKWLDSYETESLPKKYTRDKAIEDGCIVVDSSSNDKDKLSNFIKNLEIKKDDKIRVVKYTDEGDAVIYDILSNSGHLRVIYDNSRDGYGGDTGIVEYVSPKIEKTDYPSYTKYDIKADKFVIYSIDIKK